MKKVLIILFIFILLKLTIASDLVWWFKARRENKWLQVAVPFLLYDSLSGEKFLLGLNYPDSSEKDVKISGEVSFSYILKKGMELKANNVYFGEITEKAGMIQLKIKKFNLKKFVISSKTIKETNIKNLLNSLSHFIYGDKEKELNKDELLVVVEAIKKYNSERLETIRKGLKKFPESQFLRELYLKELIDEEDYESIVDFLNEPKTMKEYRIKIFSLIKLSDFESAKNLLDKIQNKSICDLNNYAVLLILSGGNKGEIREYLMEAESLSPEDWRVYYNYSLFEFKEKNLKKAKEEIEKSVKIAYKNPIQIELFKRIMEKSIKEENSGTFLKNNPKDLLSELLNDISFFPPDEEPTFLPILYEDIPIKKDTYYFKEGIEALKNKNLFISEKLLRRYLFNDPLNDRVYYALSLASFFQGKYDKALKSIEKAIMLKDKIIYELLRLELFYRTGDQGNFDSLYNHLKSRYPANTDIDKIRNRESFNFPPPPFE